MKRARRSELFYFALEEGSSQAVSQLPFLPAGSLFLLGFPLCSFLLCRLFLGFPLCSFLLCCLFLRLALGDFLLRLFLSCFLLSLTLGYFFLRLFLGCFLLGLALGYLFLRFFLSCFLLRSLFLLGYFFLRLFLGDFLLCFPLCCFLLCYFFLRLFPGGFFLCYAAFLRRCSFLCSYFPLLRDFSLRSFFTRLLFGSHAFLRVGYPELSIYNKTKKTSKPIECRRLQKNAGEFMLLNEAKTF